MATPDYYDTTGTLPPLFREMTICSSTELFLHFALNLGYDFARSVAKGEGMQMKCSRRGIHAVFVMCISSTLALVQLLMTAEREPAFNPFGCQRDLACRVRWLPFSNLEGDSSLRRLL